MSKFCHVTLAVACGWGAATRAADFYVDAARPDDSGDGLTWSTAKRTIQAAADLALAGETVWVAGGVYAPVTTDNKAVTIRSVDGAAATAIDGGWVNRCATLGSNTVLAGFTLRNGRAESGGGAIGGTLNNCTLSGNTAWRFGGGAWESILNACVLTGNAAGNDGGGAWESTLNNCVLTGNTAKWCGGGAWESTLNNCTLAGNTAGYYGGGPDGGGSYGGTLNNCVVWGNALSDGDSNNYFGGAFLHSCAAPLPPGPGNTAADPLFADAPGGDFRLRAGSPCIDAGTNAYAAGGSDIDGNARIQGGTVDMGAHEGALGSPGDFIVAVRVSGRGSVAPARAAATAPGGSLSFVALPGEAAFLGFLTNGVFATDSPAFTWADIAADGTLTAVFERFTFHADASRPDDSGDGLTWATAKRTIQAAVDLAASGETVRVADGVYAPVATGNKAVTVRSVNGAAATAIDGGGTNRCATLMGEEAFSDAGAVLDGFTLRNGAGDYGGGALGGTLNNCVLTGNRASYGGGACSIALNNCTLAENVASLIGGGTAGGTLDNCTISGNVSGSDAGGAWGGILNNCTLTGNTAWGIGGGVYGGTLNNCVLSDNTAGGDGGGAYFGTLNNCTVRGNTAAAAGGGVYWGSLNNCVVSGNAAGTAGGGAYLGTLNNCTVWGNTAAHEGGGTCGSGEYVSRLNNCIVWGNTLGGGGSATNYSGGTLLHSCAAPLPPGPGNIAADPRLVDAVNGDMRLRAGSPCIDAGTNAYAAGGTDLTGGPRIQGGTVDMGACEGGVAGFVISVRVQGTAGAVSDRTAVVPAGGSAAFTAAEAGRPFLRFLTNGVFATDSPAFTWTGIAADGTLTAVFETFKLHADASRPDDSGDGLTWATAKRTIQAAVDLALPGETVRVADGVYAPIATGNKKITIRSANGAAATAIEGNGWVNRCAVLGRRASVEYFRDTGTVLDGFTLRYGFAADCGGGSVGGTLNNCILAYNWSMGDGGGAAGGILNNCVLTDNLAEYGDGGGAYRGTLNNCTLTCNWAGRGGGGAASGTLNNCIVWGNALTGGGSGANHDYSALRHSCTAPLPADVNDLGGNICADPLFADAAAGDFRLRPGSPCVDAGADDCAAGETDLAGRPRIQNSAVDMGAYEGVLGNRVISVRAEGGGTVTPSTAQSVAEGGSAAFTAQAGASAAFRYFLTNGVFASASSTFTWENIKTDGVLTAVFGAVPAAVALPEALDSAALDWVTDGAAGWSGQRAVTRDGEDAAQSGSVAHGEESWLETQMAGDRDVSFWWRVSSEAGWDWLEFRVDGALDDRISGDSGWERKTVTLPAGTHTLRWRYVKDGVDLDPVGADCGWVDQVTVSAADAIPLEWRALYGLPADGSADHLDSDDDGLSNWQEWVAGTVPTNAASRFLGRIGTAGGRLRLHWTPDLTDAAPARVYSVYGTASLGQGIPDTPATNVPAGTPVPVDALAPLRFFRIGVDLER